jgi:hypothetical protein
MIEIDKEIKDKINALASIAVAALREEGAVLMNIQIEEEYSQYDVLLSYNFANFGAHQRGIMANDLIIGVIGLKEINVFNSIPKNSPFTSVRG